VISYSRLRRQHGTKAIVFMIGLVLAAAATLLAPAVASPNALSHNSATPMIQPAMNDTLIASPWVQEVLNDWKPDSERFFCVARMAEWENVVFILDLRETTAAEKCNGPEIIFAQLSVCPDVGTKFAGPQRYTIIECGPWVFKKYRTLGGIGQPKTFGIEAA